MRKGEIDMKKAFALIGIVGAALCAVALDNTVVNDFWDTTGYVNGTTSARTGTLGAKVDSRMKVVRETNAPATFSTYNGTLITFR